jgi:hypothetical protein
MGDDWFLLAEDDQADHPKLRVYQRRRGEVSPPLPFGSYRLANGYLRDVPAHVDTVAILAEVEALLTA